VISRMGILILSVLLFLFITSDSDGCFKESVTLFVCSVILISIIYSLFNWILTGVWLF